MVFHIMLGKAEDDWIMAECPALPGCVLQGKAKEKALANIKEAITAWYGLRIKRPTNLSSND